MDRIKKLKIKKQDGTFTDYIPIGADAQNIDMNNGFSVQANIGNIDIEKDGDISTQLNEIDNEEVLYYFNPQSKTLVNSGETNLISGECQIIKAYGKVIMIDTGGTNRSQSIRNFLESINVDKVDYLIISHWHYDHCTNFFSNMDYIDWSDCVCYFPLDIPSWAQEDNGHYNYNHCMSYANTHCKQIIFPEDWDELVLNKFFKITFYNCGQEAYDEIKDIQDDIEEYAGHYDGSYPNQYYFNDYSLLALVEHNGNKVLYSGDAMKANQERAYLANFGTNVDLYKMHHHGVNNMGQRNCIVNLQYCTMVNPKNVVILNGNQGDMNYTYGTDVALFSESNIYYVVKDTIIFATKANQCYQKTNAIKTGVSSADWQSAYLFVSPDDYDSNYIPDGSYNRPFWYCAGVSSYFNNSGAKNINSLTIVIKPCSNSSASFENTFGRSREIALVSYDYYKYGENAFPVDSYGMFTQQAITNLKKYKIRGFVRNATNGRFLIRGISLMPNDNSIEKLKFSDTGDIYVPAQSRTGVLDLYKCLISYEEVTKDQNMFYNGVRVNGCGILRVNDCYFSDCIIAVNAVWGGEAYIGKCMGERILKFAGQENGMVHYTASYLGATLRNVHLERPSWTSIQDAICWHIFCQIDIIEDSNAKFCYDENDNPIHFEEWIRKVNQWPWSYRNTVPSFLTYREGLINPVLGYFYTNSPWTRQVARDPYGANLDDYNLGAVVTGAGYDLAKKDIDKDLNNLKSIGVYYIAGTNAALTYLNCPTPFNCRIIVSKLTTGSYTVQEVQARDGSVYRRIYDETEANKWSEWQTVLSPATWNSSI